MMPYQLRRMVQRVLTRDLLSPTWRQRVSGEDHPTTGHCYVAAEALWHLVGERDWQPYVASYVENGERCTHWWLVNKRTGRRLDPTREQYDGQPPYAVGRKAGFLTRKPSKRAKIVIERVFDLLST